MIALRPATDTPTRPVLPPRDAASARAREELEKLYRAEFGLHWELAVRYVLILASSVAAYFYAEMALALVWGGIFFGTQALTFVALRQGIRRATQGAWALGAACYMTTTLAFLAFPLALFTFAEGTLAYCGAVGMLTFCSYCFWRDEPPKFLLYYDASVAWVFAAAAISVFLPGTEDRLAQVMIVLLTCGAATYYSAALIATRRNRGALRNAAQRATEAQKMEAIGRLSGGIAHDFNNILTVMQGNLELSQEVKDPAERETLISEAHLATRRAAGLVQQLLAFARRAPLEPTVFELHDVIEEVVSMSARLLPATITVFPAFPVAPVQLRADRDQLLSSLLNLVINARDAMPEGGELTIAARTITVTAQRPHRDLEAGPYVAFSVTDTGHGMPPEMVERAIEPFFTTKPVGGGSGFGLPMANGFATQSGGTLTIESGHDGTTVTIYLLRVQRPQAETSHGAQ